MPDPAALATSTTAPRPSGGSSILDAVRLTFNAAAPHFEGKPLFFWDVVGSRTVDLAGIGPGMDVLDVCCGAGASALAAAERVGPAGTVLGVDIAERLLARGRARAYAAHLGNARFVVGDMENLQVADESADAVVCVFGLYYAQDRDRALRHLWRAVRPGGMLAVTVWGARSLEPGHTRYLEAVSAELPAVDPASATPTSRLGDEVVLRDLLARVCSQPPTVLVEVLTHPCSPTEFWSIVLGSGYRVSLDAMGPAAANRVRSALLDTLRREGMHEVVSDVLYAQVAKPARAAPAEPR